MTIVHRWILTCVLALPLTMAAGACGDEDGGVTDDDAGVPVLCEPACSPSLCTTCDESGAEPTCVSLCGEGTSCEDGVCVPPEITRCTPDCGSCQACDTSGDTPVCVDICAEGTTCVDGRCNPPDPEEVACNPACGDCELCDISTGEPVCVSLCGPGQVCEADTCIRETIHGSITALAGPFDSPQDVTDTCVGCHEEEASAFLNTAHWNWDGPAPNVVNHGSEDVIGKRTLINNFCIAVVSNEKRCSECHSGYGWQDATFDFADTSNIDCLVCHADPASNYERGKKTAGMPPDTVDLALAALSVGPTTRQNCGSCHFFAGGGDNVKKGDLGSALAFPSFEQDVHMGMGFTCSTCHQGESHGTMLGASAHVPVTEGRVLCSDCHGEAPHERAQLNEHAQDIACQTCHIPAFSRMQATKTFWDWSTAGDRTRGTDGIVRGTVGPSEVDLYNFMKGDFEWGHDVAPTYGWWDGRVERLTMYDNFEAGQGTESNPVMIARPVATHSDMDARIFPFKVMRGRQAGHPTDRYLIVPHLFGPGGFWPGGGGLHAGGRAHAVDDRAHRWSPRRRSAVGRRELHRGGVGLALHADVDGHQPRGRARHRSTRLRLERLPRLPRLQWRHRLDCPRLPLRSDDRPVGLR